jgi:hypothetical protein
MNTIKHTEDYDDVFNFKHEANAEVKEVKRVLKPWVKMILCYLISLVVIVGVATLAALVIINDEPSECERAYGYNASDCRNGSWSEGDAIQRDSIYNSTN